MTGSRTWHNGTLLHAKLEECRVACVATDDILTVVHGGAMSGGDMYANGWARWHHANSTNVGPVEVHPAHWEGPCRDKCWPGHRRQPTPETIRSRSGLKPGWSICPRAGYYRNELMVSLGADLCLAFIADESRGASHCAQLAWEAGIKTVRFTESSSPQLAFDI